MNEAFLGLGSNMGNRIEHMRRAVAALESDIAIKKLSSVYESAPHGVSVEQPLYLNMVLSGETALAPRALLALAKKIEQDMGRMPGTHNEPRPIDIDILIYGDWVHEEEDLMIPHPRMHERHFVLVPLEEIASFHIHPTLNKPIIDLLDELGGYERVVWRSEEQFV